jgi:DNA polymerase-3 subunit gamma/tau
MSYTVLARRYRSGTFDEVVGQQHIAQTLKKAIETDRLAHAYLFCGTRGTGKTSMARILAKALNCQNAKGPTPAPCGKCDSCLSIARGDDIDVIEIDAASNTGVDNVREIIENSRYRPARSRFKVYIIDEVHMLSKSAFNALLKTLEEPPEHVKFILATTEPEKVLPTILSRCQRYDFRNISAREIAGHLKNISKQEKIEADEDALTLVARAGNGSMRDSLSLLDRLLSLGEKRLTAKMIEQMLGLPRTQLINQLTESIGKGDVKAILSQVDEMIAGGLSPDTLLSVLSDQFRNLLILRACGPTAADLLDLPADTQLAALAEKFDPALLSQNIAIIEELRRNMRANQTGRALLDATLVRLALAEQFSSIDQLLSGSAPAPDIKKKPPESVIANPSPLPVSSASFGTTGEGQNVKPATTRASPSFSPSPGLPAEVSSPATPPASEPSVVPVSDDDVVKIWPRLIAMLKPHGSALIAGLNLATLASLKDGQAVIRFSSGGETFAKNWASNGKREIIGRTLSQIRGQPVELKFEISTDDSPPSTQSTVQSSAQSAGQSAMQVAPSPRVSVEIPDEVRADSLVQAVLKEFGGEIVKCE